MKRHVTVAVLLSGLLLTACGVEAIHGGGPSARAATVCTCQDGFAQDGVLLAYPSPAGCALPMAADGTLVVLSPCDPAEPEVVPGDDRRPRHTL